MDASRRIEQLAAAWLARRDGERWTRQDQAELDTWLRASTAHRVAYLRLESAWRESGRLKALGAGLPPGEVPPRGRWTAAPFVAHGEPPRAPAAPAIAPDAPAALVFSGRAVRPRQAPRLGRVLGAVAVGGAIALSSLWGWRSFTAVERVSYASGLGDVQRVTLPDGSGATLSSDSRIQVALSRRERRVDLQRGEAFFEVAHDPRRPFVVQAGGRRAIAVGTRYAVRRDGERLRVVVTEGTVRLETDRAPGRNAQPTTLLPAGSVALADARGMLVRAGSVEDAEQQLNWRNGFLAFRDTPLADAAAEFNRYNARKIVMGDPEVARLRVGGNFRWSNIEVFVRLLEQGFPVRAERREDRIVLHSE